MRLIPVALALFHKKTQLRELEVWVQRREDDGPFHGLMEFPGGGIEPGEEPMDAAIREVHEEVGIKISKLGCKFMGIYPSHYEEKTILLYVFLFPDPGVLLENIGRWLCINGIDLSSPFRGIIPGPNHLIIDDLYKSLYDDADE